MLPVNPRRITSPLSLNKAHPTYRPFSLHEEATRPVSVRPTVKSSVSLSLPSFLPCPSEQPRRSVPFRAFRPSLVRSLCPVCPPVPIQKSPGYGNSHVRLLTESRRSTSIHAERSSQNGTAHTLLPFRNILPPYPSRV